MLLNYIKKSTWHKTALNLHIHTGKGIEATPVMAGNITAEKRAVNEMV